MAARGRRRLPAELRAALPDAMARYITDDLASLEALTRRPGAPDPAGGQRSYFSLAWRGTRPNLPAWKSVNACAISVRLFITNGPPIATGSRIGRPL